MSFDVTVKPTWRDVAGRFSKAEQVLIDARRDELRVEGRAIVDLVQKKLQAKTAPYNSSSLAKSIRFNTRKVGNDVRLNITSPSKAGPHKIYPRFANALSFMWPKAGRRVVVPKRGGFKTHVRANGTLFVGKGYVDHPGGSLEPLMNPIMQAAGREWLAQRGQQALRRMSTRYVESLTK